LLGKEREIGGEAMNIREGRRNREGNGGVKGKGQGFEKEGKGGLSALRTKILHTGLRGPHSFY
jgi:hypothetical protein